MVVKPLCTASDMIIRSLAPIVLHPFKYRESSRLLYTSGALSFHDDDGDDDDDEAHEPSEPDRENANIINAS